MPPALENLVVQIMIMGSVNKNIMVLAQPYDFFTLLLHGFQWQNVLVSHCAYH